MFVRMCMAPRCSLSATAVAWSLLLSECVNGIIPFIEITRYFSNYVVLTLKFYNNPLHFTNALLVTHST